MQYKYFFSLLGLLLIASCASKKDVIYMQDISRLDSLSSKVSYETLIGPNDLLAIIVTAENMETVRPFNLPITTVQDVNQNNIAARANQPYLVSPSGEIDFPRFGLLNVKNKSREEVAAMITKKLKKYIKDPRVDVRIQNFKVTVLGEVSNPGTFPILDERVTILEALGLAGDMTIYGERSTVLVLREEEGVKKYARVDFTKSEFLDSPYYYLRQNDVVIVEQNNAEVQRSISNPITSIYFSVASLLITLLVIFTR